MVSVAIACVGNRQFLAIGRSCVVPIDAIASINLHFVGDGRKTECVKITMNNESETVWYIPGDEGEALRTFIRDSFVGVAR